MDDVQVVRTAVMRQELLHGQFPVRYVDEFGNGGGYMLFQFYSPLPYYLGAIINLSGLTLVKTTKIVFLLSYLVGLVGMYFLLRVYTRRVVAVIGTILFIASTYLSFDVYFRGALAEVYAFMFVPWVFYGWSKVKQTKSTGYILLTAVSYALLIISHTLIAFATSLLLGIYLLLPPLSLTSMKRNFYTLSLGVGLSAFFWFPSFIEQRFIQYSSSYFVTDSYKGNFLNPLQIAGLQPIPWNFLPPLLGLGLFAGTLLGLYLYIKQKKFDSFYFFCLLGFGISVLFTWDITKVLWEKIIYLRYMQFPYRWLTLTTFFAVVITSLALNRIKNQWLAIALGVLFLLPTVSIYYHYLRPTNYRYVSDEIYKAEDACSTTAWANEHLPIWVKECLPKKNTFPLVKTTDDTIVRNVRVGQNGREISFQTSGKQSRVLVKRYYFPEWTATVDGANVTDEPYTKYGLVSFIVPEGKHTSTIRFQNTWANTIGNIVSLVSIGIGVLLLWKVVAEKFYQQFDTKPPKSTIKEKARKAKKTSV